MQLLAPHAPVVLELVQKVLADDNSGEPLDKLAFGVIGDLADAFPNGELKPLLLAEWIASSLVSRKGYDKETKTTIKWAREVRCSSISRSVCVLMNCNPVDGEACDSMRAWCTAFAPLISARRGVSFFFLFFTVFSSFDDIPAVSTSRSRHISQFSLLFTQLFSSQSTGHLKEAQYNSIAISTNVIVSLKLVLSSSS